MDSIVKASSRGDDCAGVADAAKPPDRDAIRSVNQTVRGSSDVAKVEEPCYVAKSASRGVADEERPKCFDAYFPGPRCDRGVDK